VYILKYLLMYTFYTQNVIGDS